MAGVILKDVSKVYPGGVVAVEKMNLEIIDREFIIFVGPSGCGKSTTLRMIAGLEEISDGEVYIDQHVVNDIPPKDRDIAMVFQNYALYPHMSVYKNMSFGLRLKKYPNEEIVQRVNEAAEVLKITPLLDRKPKALSGGQRQRVAVGRAIVRKPKVFLFDEPLSNLDAKMRLQMRAELQKLHVRLQSTMIYVTHDQIEAMSMGDRIVVMNDGLIQQVDTPLKIYDYPINKFVAGFIGSPAMNFIDGKLVNEDGKLYFNEGSFKIRLIEEMARKVADKAGKEVVLGIRPESIFDKVYFSKASPENTIHAVVEVVEPLGSEVNVYLTTGKSNMIARLDSHATQIQANQDMELTFDMARIHIFDKETEKNLTI